MPESDLVQMERHGRWDRHTGSYGKRGAREKVLEICLIFTLLPKLQHILRYLNQPQTFLSDLQSQEGHIFFSFCLFTSGMERGAGEMGLSLKCLLREHEDLSLIPRIHIKKKKRQVWYCMLVSPALRQWIQNNP